MLSTLQAVFGFYMSDNKLILYNKIKLVFFGAIYTEILDLNFIHINIQAVSAGCKSCFHIQYICTRLPLNNQVVFAVNFTWVVYIQIQ